MSPLTKIPPPAALVVMTGGALLLTRYVPALQAVWFRSLMAAVVVLVFAVAWMLWATIEFRRFRTTILPLRKPTSLLCAGPFRISRNPLYLAMVFVAATPWLVWGEVGLLLGPLGFFTFINRIIIPFEEAKLRGIFGAAYDEYCRRVRRWC